MFIETKLKEKFPGISTPAIEAISYTALKRGIQYAVSRAIDQIHLGHEEVCTKPVLDMLSEESEDFWNGGDIADGVIFGLIQAFKRSGHIPETVSAFEINNYLDGLIRDFIDEPITWF